MKPGIEIPVSEAQIPTVQGTEEEHFVSNLLFPEQSAEGFRDGYFNART